MHNAKSDICVVLKEQMDVILLGAFSVIMYDVLS